MRLDVHCKLHQHYLDDLLYWDIGCFWLGAAGRVEERGNKTDWIRGGTDLLMLFWTGSSVDGGPSICKKKKGFHYEVIRQNCDKKYFFSIYHDRGQVRAAFDHNGLVDA